MNTEPDLSAELDAAEEIVMGRAETVVTEWGGRNLFGGIGCYGSGPDNERQARANAATDGLYRRTVTYGPWREVNDSAPAGAVKEDGGP